MTKYIDVEKLTAEIERRRSEAEKIFNHIFEYASSAKEISEWVSREYNNLLSIIDSLQQEQPEIQNGKFVFPKYLYARTKDNKTIDMSYVPQDMTAVEYIRKDFVEQERTVLPDNLDEAAEKYGDEYVILPDDYNDGEIDFYAEETGKAFKAGAEWMAGQMNQKQPEVDLEKEYTEFVESDPVYSKLVNGIVGKAIARHFAEWGARFLNARNEE